MEDEQNHLPPPVMSEPLERVKESLENAIHVLSGILSDVKSGTYTKKQASLDAENLMMNDGLDYVSSILDYSESEEE